jgi:hypothetical protein
MACSHIGVVFGIVPGLLLWRNLIDLEGDTAHCCFSISLCVILCFKCTVLLLSSSVGQWEFVNASVYWAVKTVKKITTCRFGYLKSSTKCPLACMIHGQKEFE